MKSMMGVCEYCGSEIGVMAETQGEANEIASDKCCCGGSHIAKKKTRLREKLKEIAGPGCEALSFTPVDSRILKHIEDLGYAAIEGEVQQISIKVNGTVIQIKGGEKTKITRKYTYERGEEIE